MNTGERIVMIREIKAIEEMEGTEGGYRADGTLLTGGVEYMFIIDTDGMDGWGFADLNLYTRGEGRWVLSDEGIEDDLFTRINAETDEYLSGVLRDVMRAKREAGARALREANVLLVQSYPWTPVGYAFEDISS